MQDQHQEFDLSQDFDVEEVEIYSEEEDVIIAGEIEIWKVEASEKARVRPYIAAIIVAIWAICTITGIMYVVFTGNIYATVSALINAPMYFVLRFYFKSDTRQSRGNHEHDENERKAESAIRLFTRSTQAPRNNAGAAGRLDKSRSRS